MTIKISLNFLNSIYSEKHPKDVKVLLAVPSAQNNYFLDIGTCSINYSKANGSAYGIINSKKIISLGWYCAFQTNVHSETFEEIRFYEEPPNGFPLLQIRDILLKDEEKE